jgi:hypothetical protein
MAELTLADATHGASGGEGGDKKAHTPCVRTRLARGHTDRPVSLFGRMATVVMPASMCENAVKDCHLEHLATGGDMQRHCRPSTASVTTRKDHA